MKELVFRHFEKGILALCGLLLLGPANPILGRPGDLKDVEKVRALEQTVATHFETFTPALPPVPDNFGPVRASVETSSSVEPFPSWLLHRRPNLAAWVIEVAPPPPTKHYAPKLELKVEHGAVTVTWAPSLDNECAVTSYAIKRTDASGKTIVLKETTDAGTLTDTQVEERASYTYSVTEIAEARPSGYAPIDVKVAALSAEKPATLPRDWVILPTDWVTVDPVLGPVDVKVFVYRWKDGQWVGNEVQFLKVGEKIGKKGPRGDFSSGAELLEITQKGGVTAIRVKWANGVEETAHSTDSPEGVKHRRK